MTEAGEDETSVGQIPLLASYLPKSKNDWQYTTVPQGSGLCTALKNNKYSIFKPFLLISIVITL